MKHALIISLLGLSALLSGCGGGSTSAGSGTLSVSLTDAPIDEASAVWIEFTGVSIKKQSDTGSETIDDPSEWTDIFLTNRCVSTF